METIFADLAQADQPGACVAVVQDGALAWSAAYGLADVRDRRACTTRTCFRLASVTKQLTAMAVLLLAEEGRLASDWPIGRLVDRLPDYAAEVTIHQLLCHTAGLVDYEDLLPAERTEQILDAEVAQILPRTAEQGRYFAPGSAYRYSNTGYVLLALAAEQASGQPFAAVLRERIFAPLGMTTALAYVRGGPEVAERAYGHSWIGSAWQVTDQSVTSATLGDGGVYASVEDLACWLAALDRGAIGQAATRQAAWSAWASTPEGEGYGYGWKIATHRGEPLIRHSGTTMGFRSATIRLPQRGISVAVLLNRSVADPTGLALQVADRFA
ncbi:MAG: serine hydrolase domain-containing protein [Roseiflexaceae bacterium]